MTNVEFARHAGVPQSPRSLVVINELRHYVARAAGAPFQTIHPDDDFRGNLANALSWPEFDAAPHPIATIEQRLNLRLPDSRADRIVDPSSPRRKGTVGNLVRETLQLVDSIADPRRE